MEQVLQYRMGCFKEDINLAFPKLFKRGKKKISLICSRGHLVGYWENPYGHWVEQSWKRLQNGKRKFSSLEGFRGDTVCSCQEGQMQT